MLKIYTKKKYLTEREVVYEPIKYFDMVVCSDIHVGKYHLSDDDYNEIYNDCRVLDLKADCIKTVYGDASLKDISKSSKMFILMRYIHKNKPMAVVNLSGVNVLLDKVLHRANEYGNSVYVHFTNSNIECFSGVDFEALFNDKEKINISKYIDDLPVIVPGNMGNCLQELRLFALEDNITVNIDLEIQCATFFVPSCIAKNTILKTIKKSIENRSIKAITSSSTDNSDIHISPDEIIIADNMTREQFERLVEADDKTKVFIFDKSKNDISSYAQFIGLKNNFFIGFCDELYDCTWVYANETRKKSLDGTTEYIFNCEGRAERLSDIFAEMED